RRTLDGIAVTPLGRAADLENRTTAGRPTRVGAWDIRSQVGLDDPKATHDAALAELEGGATSLWLVADGASGAPEVATALTDVLLDLAPVVLESRGDAIALAQAFLAYADERGLDPHPGSNLGADPVGAALRAERDPAIGEELAAVARLAADHGILGVVVDATVVHDRGASDVQELGYATALGAAYLRALTDAGLELAQAAALVEFRFAATGEQFPTIAKLRAARRLWARVLELSGAAESDRIQRQHAVTSRPMLSAYDPYVNMLRTTVAAFAAGVGGADAVTVLPFDSPLGRSESFGRRIARNVSHLLIEESRVAQVTDPAGGAYAVERLTDELAVAGWEELGRVEESGGVVAALTDASFWDRVAEVVARRDQQVAQRKRPITGLSEFPDAAETRLVRESDPLQPPVRRYGAAFEALRDEPRGSVFLASMGTVAAHTARVTFASNLFAAGGIAVTYPGPLPDVDAVLAAYDGRPVVCLAGSDAAYAEWGRELVAALREAGAQHVILAGKPGELDVDDSCAMGVDALAFLNRTREVSA
ncbi:methylmalonyl-CoA mutase family protein, partial [Nocardioides massiliensis]